MRFLIIILLSQLIYFNGSGQVNCSGPLDIKIIGSTTGNPISVDHIAYDIFCRNVDEGAIELNIQGGSPEFHCEWNNGAESPNIYDLSPGVYSVTITDDKDCQDTLMFEIEVMNPMEHGLVFLEDSGCGSCYLQDSLFSFFYYETKYMACIKDLPDGRDLAQVLVCTETRDEVYYMNDRPTLNRSWCVSSDGGAGHLSLYFSEEEFGELHEVVNQHGLRSTDLRILGFSGGAQSFEHHDTMIIIDEFSLTLFDNIEEVWSLEFTSDDLPEEICFMVEYKGESPTTANEDLIMIEHADYRILNNPAFDAIRLEVINLEVSQRGNIIIYNELGQEVYSDMNRMISSGIETYDVLTYPAGVYFLTIEFLDLRHSKTFKFIKLT